MVDTIGVFRTQSNIGDRAFFAKIVNGFESLTIFAKNSIVDIRLVSKYASEYNNKLFPDVLTE